MALERLERYARWTLDRLPQDLGELARARRALRGAMRVVEGGGVEDALQALRLKGTWVELEGRFRACLSERWFAYRRHRALREWAGAREALRAIRRATDPSEPDSQTARRLLEGLASRR